MCLIVHYDPAQHSAPPDRDILHRGNKQNPHGAGLLRLGESGQWTRERRLNLTAKQLDRWIDDCMAAGRQWAVHFRWSTGGGEGKQNVHPFDIGGGFYLMHNGTLTIDPTASASDTNILASWLRREKLGARLRSIAPIIDGLRRGSRLLIVGPGGAVDYWGEWHREDHGTYSNKNCHWAPAERPTYTPGAAGAYRYYPDTKPGLIQAPEPRPALVGTWCPDRLAYVDAQGICRRWNHDRRSYQVIPDPRPGLPAPGFNLVAPKYAPLSRACDRGLWEPEDTDDLTNLLAKDDEEDRNFRRSWGWE